MQGLRSWLEDVALQILQPPNGENVEDEFSSPAGESALASPDSMSWRLFKNPVALFVGGIAAVVLELAEPRVRTGVWKFTSFRERPMLRLQRTARAAMIAVYGARSRAEAMIEAVVKKHDRVRGETPDGIPFRANEVALLDWVHVTASFGIVEATHAHVGPLSRRERDQFYGEATVAAHLFGATGAPSTQAEVDQLIESMRGKLEPSPIVHEFLDIMSSAALLPPPLRPMQRALVSAGVALVPGWVQDELHLRNRAKVGAWERALVTLAARSADRVVLRALPPAVACRRVGLPVDYLARPIR